MTKQPSDKDQAKGDDVLRRLLKTPPEPKPGKGKPPAKGSDDEPVKTPEN